MKGRILSLIIILLMIAGSFGAIGTHTENDCGCGSNYVDSSIEDKPERYTTSYVGELRDTSGAGTTFMGGPPSTFNWKDFGGRDFTTNARSQGQCGSCYAFATISVVESVLDILDLNPNLNKDLSEQYIVSCASDDLPYTVWGCNGAWYTPPPGFANFIDWTRDNDVVSESCFPYTSGGGSVPPCDDSCPRIADVVGWGWVDSSNRLNIKNALITQGPLTAYMKVYDDFYGYSGGIYEHTSGGEYGDHMVAIVGYNENQDYWICKNSWSTYWGENGFFKIKFDNCDIEEHIAFIEADYGDPTATKHANEYYDKTDRWTTWGTHGMQCDNSIWPSDDYIYYKFNVPKDSPGPIIIGIEFKADLLGANAGPDLEVKEPGGSWVKIRQSMGGPNSLTWKWFHVLNDYISSSDELKFRILCAWGCHAYLDDVAVMYTEPVPPEPDLDCIGSINGGQVKPGTYITGSFTVKNIGDEGSLLDWKVDSYPSWGSSWSFTPSSGNDLPAGSSKTVQVSFYAPDYEDSFSGSIKVVNKEDSGDSDTVPVSVTTPKSHARPLFFNILELLQARFPQIFRFINSSPLFKT